jgi:spore germination protein YaaH
MGHQLLSSTALVDQVAAQLVDEAHVRGYSGYQLDFENLAAGDRPALSRFSAALAGKLKTAGLEYSVAVIPRRLTSSPRGPSAVYDYAALYRGAGWLTMMAYDQHTRQEDPGPVAALDWVKEVIGVTSARLDRSRLYLGVPLYARDFSMAAAPASLPYADAVNVTAQNGGSVRWDFDAATARAEYVSAGVQHEVWMDGRASLEAKVGLAREQHFAGVSAWRLGYEDPDFWALWPSR